MPEQWIYGKAALNYMAVKHPDVHQYAVPGSLMLALRRHGIEVDLIKIDGARRACVTSSQLDKFAKSWLECCVQGRPRAKRNQQISITKKPTRRAAGKYWQSAAEAERVFAGTGQYRRIAPGVRSLKEVKDD